MQQGGILSEVGQSVKLWKLFNDWTVTIDFAERIIIGKKDVHGLGSIVQLLSNIVLNVMTAVDLLQQGIFCCRGGIFSIMVTIQEFMIKSAENVLVTNS